MSITHTANTVDNNLTMEAVKILKKNLSVEIKPHMTCINYSKSEIMEMTQDYLSLGVDSIVALRGNTKQSASNREPYYDKSLDFIKAVNFICLSFFLNHSVTIIPPKASVDWNGANDKTSKVALHK